VSFCSDANEPSGSITVMTQGKGPNLSNSSKTYCNKRLVQQRHTARKNVSTQRALFRISR